MKKELLKMIDASILDAPYQSEDFKIYSLANDLKAVAEIKINKCNRNAVIKESMVNHRNEMVIKHGEVLFQDGNVKYKVLKTKEHLKRFRSKINKQFKDGKIPRKKTITGRSLPSKSQCLLNMIRDNKLFFDDRNSYYLNILNAGELTGLLFLATGKDFPNPCLIIDEFELKNRNLIIVKAIKGYDVLDKLTALSVVAIDRTHIKNKNTAIEITKERLKDFEFNRDVIRKKHITQEELLDYYRKLQQD